MDRITTTGAEPVTLAEVKLAARVDNDVDANTSSLDGLIATLIATAREQAEQLTARVYRPGVFRAELDDWPAPGQVLPLCRPTACAVMYWSGAAMVPLAAPAYAFAAGGPGGVGTVMAPALGTSWPALALRAVGPRVQIDLTAGPASPADVASRVKTYIAASVAAWLRTPEALASASLGPHPLFAHLLDGENTFA